MPALQSPAGVAALADGAATIHSAVARNVPNAGFFDALIEVLKNRLCSNLRAQVFEQCAIAVVIATAWKGNGVEAGCHDEAGG
jgi:hypothetical protein